MDGMLGKFDAFVLEKLFTPLAHYIQRRFCVISYEISKLCFEIVTALVLLTAIYLAFFIEKEWSVFSSIVLAFGLVMSLAIYVFVYMLSMHLSKSNAWQYEPLIKEILCRRMPWVFPFIFLICAIGLLHNIANLYSVVTTVPSEESLHVLPESWNPQYQMLKLLRHILEPMGFYFLRVRPLPPSENREKENSFVPEGTGA